MVKEKYKLYSNVFISFLKMLFDFRYVCVQMLFLMLVYPSPVMFSTLVFIYVYSFLDQPPGGG